MCEIQFLFGVSRLGEPAKCQVFDGVLVGVPLGPQGKDGSSGTPGNELCPQDFLHKKEPWLFGKQ